MKTAVYRCPLPRTPNDFQLRLGVQSTAHQNYTRNVPGVLVPHLDSLFSGRVEGIAIISRVPPALHQAVSEAVTRAVKLYYSDAQ